MGNDGRQRQELEARQTLHWRRVWNKDSRGVTRPRTWAVTRLGCLNIYRMPALQDQAALP